MLSKEVLGGNLGFLLDQMRFCPIVDSPYYGLPPTELLCALSSIHACSLSICSLPLIPYRYACAACNYGRCLPPGHRGYLVFLPRAKRYRAEFNSRPLIVATRFVPIRACSNVYTTTQRAQRQLIRRGCN